MMWFWKCKCLGDDRILLVKYLDEGDALFLDKMTFILETIDIAPTMSDTLLIILTNKVSQLPPNSLEWNLIQNIAEKMVETTKISIWKMFLILLKKRSGVINQLVYIEIIQTLNNLRYRRDAYDDNDWIIILQFLSESIENLGLDTVILTEILRSFDTIVIPSKWPLFMKMLHKVNPDHLDELIGGLTEPILSLQVIMDISGELAITSSDRLWKYLFLLLKSNRAIENVSNNQVTNQVSNIVTKMNNILLESTQLYHILSAVEILTVLYTETHVQVLIYDTTKEEELLNFITTSRDTASIANFRFFMTRVKTLRQII
jgi:hypothetical protein